MQKESFRRRLGGRLSRLGRSSQAPGETSIQPSSRPQANPNVGMDLAPMTEPATTAAKPPSVNQASGGTRESTTTKDDKSQTQSNQSGAHTVDGKYGFNPKQSTFSDDFGSLTISSDPWDIPQAVSSLGTKERTGPGSSRMPPRFCRLCLAIDLLNIPPEDANGYPHYQSVLELEASALSCSMCRLLLDAGRQRAEDVKLTGKAEWVTTIPAPKGGDGSVMEEDKHGAYLPDVMLPKEVTSNEVVRDHHKAHHAEPSTDPTVLRPWIYGNWYLPDDWSPSKGKVFSHLTGIGVRFSAGPAPDIRKEKNGKYTMSYQGSYIRVCTGDGNKYSAVIPGRLREQDSSSDIAIQRLREWVGWCDNNHRCSTAVIDDPPLPTRVLDLGRLGDESRIVTLLHSNGKHGRYVALSHCWGKSPRTVLTSATMEDLKSPGIAISYLPKTFRDAVNLTRKLGVRYLWVDSFCILQDSVTDWEQEGKRMSDVYAQAYLTISASASKDSFSGCFPSRDATYIPPDVLTLGASTRRDPSKPVTIKHAEMEPPHRVFAELHFFPEWMPSSTANAKKVYQIGTFGRSFDPLLKEHISTRAWTVQERLLSPRTLHFATDQMYWECRCNILSEDGALFQPSFFSTDLLLETQMIKFEDHGMQGSGISFIEGDWPSIKGRGQRWRGGWLAHTVGFCQRNMTNEQDKLPALSGIARFLAQKTGDRYLAGLWKSHLLEDLHWRTYEREESRVHGSSGFELYVRDVKLCDVVRPKEYRAPTWSWASLDSHILFNELSFKHIVAEVIDCQTTPAGIDPYGRVSGGFLKIKAPLFQVSPLSSAYIPWVKHGTPVQINLPNAASISASSAKIPYPHSHISVGTANFDFGPSFPCIALFLDAANCLLLRQSRNGQTFERIGIAQFCRPSFSRIKNREVPAPKRLGKNEKVTLDDVLHVRLGASGPKGTWGPITEEHEKRVVTIV